MHTAPTLAVLMTALLSMALPAPARAIEPLETFADLPPIKHIDLAPDGTHAVVLRAVDETYHATLMDLTTGKSRILMAADPAQFRFNWCRFANQTRVVCSIGSYIKLRAGSTGLGARWYKDARTVARRLLAIDTDATNQLQLVKAATSQARQDLVWNDQQRDQIVNWLPDDPEHVLIQLRRDDRLLPSVYKLNIYTDALTRIRRHRTSVYSWFADNDGTLRLAMGVRRNKQVVFTIVDDVLKEVDVSHLAGINMPSLVRMAADGNSVWVRANAGKDTLGFHRVDIHTAAVLETAFHHSGYDVGPVLFHPETDEPLRVTYQAEQQQAVWLDPVYEQSFKAVRRAIGNPSRLDVLTVDDKLDNAVIRTEGNGTRPTHYLFSLNSKSLKPIARLDRGSPVEFTGIEYRARDDTVIPAYIALPAAADDGPFPTVVMPHGGPYARVDDKQRFISQYLVDRGFALLLPNFRGSSGYGDAFMAKGFKEWGRTMQDDIIDGLDWMVDAKLADPQRVCIVGGSYGGYVALVASYKTPQKFQCAVSFAGVADLDMLRERQFNYQFGVMRSARIQTGPSSIENSPLHQIERIRIPILVVHGDIDTVVGIEQSRALVDALKRADKPHRYIEQTHGDHFFSLRSHRLEYLQALDAFLAEHLVEKQSRKAVGEIRSGN